MARLIALRVLLVLGGLAALYLLAANTLIKTSLLTRIANSSPSVKLEYASAYTLFPGRVHVKGLRLRSEDYNVQFEVTVESAVVDVSLLELIQRRFHALKVRAEGVGFRARHKTHSVGLDARRLAAYPPIAGFADPPLYVGPPPPPISDDEYNLWEVQLDDVEGSVRELWILEHRFQGRARVKGGFRMRPARFFNLPPSRLDIDSGTLSIAGIPTARELKGSLDCTIELTNVEKIEGLEVLRTFSVDLTLATRRGDLAAANVYTEPRLGVTAAGMLRVNAKLRMRRGTIEQPTTLELASDDVSLRRDRERLHGAARLRLDVPSRDTLELCASSPALTLERPAPPKLPGPKLRNTTLCAAVAPADTSVPMSLQRVSGSIEELDVPKLEWWSEPLARAGSRLRLSGAASSGLTFSVAPSGALSLRSRTELRGAFASDGELGVLSTGKAELSLEPHEKQPRLATGSLAVDLPHVKFARGKKISDELGVRLRSRTLTFQNVPGDRRFSGSVELEGKNAAALLELELGPAAVAGMLLGVRDLRAPVRFAMTSRTSRVEVSNAKSGALEISGFLAATPDGPTTGAFLFRTPIANFGLSLRGSKTELSSLVSDDWLPKDWTTLTPRADR